MRTQLGDGNGRPRSFFWAVVKVGNVNRKRACNLKVGELEGHMERAMRFLGQDALDR